MSLFLSFQVGRCLTPRHLSLVPPPSRAWRVDMTPPVRPTPGPACAVDPAHVSRSSSVASTSSSAASALGLPKTCARVNRRLGDVNVSAYVIGTAHVGQSSAEDVARVIRDVKPHVVVLELDQERADGLIAQYVAGDGAASVEYGSDLMTGLIQAEKYGALTMLGDVRARGMASELSNAVLRRDVLSPERWRRATGYALDALGLGTNSAGVDVLGAFIERPAMLAPLAAPTVAFAFASALMATSASASAAASAVDVATLALAAVLFCPIVETLWMSRDDVIVRNAIQGIECASGIERGTLRRVRFNFTADVDATRAAANAFVARDSAATPCFTLKRPIARGEVRRLNLWEPRWLSLMDSLAEANGGALEGAELGCLLGRSRHYCRKSWLDEVGDDGNERMGTVVVGAFFWC